MHFDSCWGHKEIADGGGRNWLRVLKYSQKVCVAYPSAEGLSAQIGREPGANVRLLCTKPKWMLKQFSNTFYNFSESFKMSCFIIKKTNKKTNTTGSIAIFPRPAFLGVKNKTSVRYYKTLKIDITVLWILVHKSWREYAITFHSESKRTTSLKRIPRKLMEHFILLEVFSSFVFKSMHCCRSVVLKVTSWNQQGKQHIWELFKNANSRAPSQIYRTTDSGDGI